ncbi:MAG: hypothetical protein AAGA18_09070 [Verrucomicrobiota bacterium]
MSSYSKRDYKHLNAACGYAQLGLYQDAKVELDQLSDDCTDEEDIMSLSLWVHQELNEWETSLKLAEALSQRNPDEPNWFIAWAYSARRFLSIYKAEEILERAMEQHPKHAMIQFNLGCYASILGNQKKASKLIKDAIKLDASYEKLAREDPDLEGLRKSDEFLNGS